MGTYANVYCANGNGIPSNKKEEFIKRIEKIFYAGGMMNINYVHICDECIPMLRTIKMDDQGINVYYNYFEDSSWENAGFEKDDCYLWSGKLGCNQFYQTIVAAYVLEELYYDGIAVTMDNYHLITSWSYVGWINYLFNENYHIKNLDPWKLFETLHYLNDGFGLSADEYNFGEKGYAFIGRYEIYAVLNGTQKAIQKYQNQIQAFNESVSFNTLTALINKLKIYKESSKENEDLQLQKLMNLFHNYFDTNGEKINTLCKDNEHFSQIVFYLFLTDAPAFAIKAISEIYSKDFWELWSSIKDIAQRKYTSLYGKKGDYVFPIPTHKFFNISPDDMVIYWKENCDIDFSRTMLQWFDSLKQQYDIISKSDFVIESPVKYIFNLLKEANNKYYQIYAFESFFEETLEYIDDVRYLALWKLFDQLIHDTELQKAGNVIFVPDDLRFKNEDVLYFRNQSRHRLVDDWDTMDPEKKFNHGRNRLRSYMALVANKPLRHKVFGF